MSDLIKSLQKHAKQKPEAPALKTLSSSISWKQFHDEILSLSAKLNSSKNLGLLLENSPAWVIADLAAINNEICNIPLPTFFSDDQLKHALNDAQIDHVITDQPERLLTLVNAIKSIPIRIADQEYYLIQLREYDLNNTEKIAKITYTSGTTGNPKGVKLPLSQIETVAQSLATAAQAKTDDRALVLLPLSTLLENIGSVFAPILVGAQIIVPSSSELGLSGSSQINAAKLAMTLQQCEPTTLIVPPQLLNLLTMLSRQQMLPGSFRYIAVGGAPASRVLLEEADELGLPVFQGYGLSEACSVVAVNRPDQNRLGSVGKPLPHLKTRITEEGEVRVKGQTFSGYLNDQVRDTSDELATGDLGYLDDDGYLYITGRINNRIITGYGRNISPEWVESELQSHIAFSQAAVLGNDQPFLIAVLVPAKNINSTNQGSELEQAIADINQRLPDYAQIGKFIIATQPFTFNNDQATANGRPRRDVIETFYSNEIETIYEVKNEQVL